MKRKNGMLRIGALGDLHYTRTPEPTPVRELPTRDS